MYRYTIYGYMGPSGTCTQTTRRLGTGLVVDHPRALRSLGPASRCQHDVAFSLLCL